MSYATFNFLKVFARWRESYLTAHPEKRLHRWVFNPLSIEDAPELPRIITVGEKGKKIMGWVAVVVVLLALASSGNSK